MAVATNAALQRSAAMQESRTTPGAALRNIDEVVRLEEAAATRRSRSERFADAIAGFVGTIAFVALHLVWFAAWAVWNTGAWHVPRIDPYPFPLLCMFVSMEGVLLSTFVLIKQNRMSARADERSHLSLQVGMLTEQEVTKLIQMLERMSRRLDMHEHVLDHETKEMGETTAVGELAERLRERLPASER